MKIWTVAYVTFANREEYDAHIVQIRDAVRASKLPVINYAVNEIRDGHRKRIPGTRGLFSTVVPLFLIVLALLISLLPLVAFVSFMQYTHPFQTMEHLRHFDDTAVWWQMSAAVVAGMIWAAKSYVGTMASPYELLRFYYRRLLLKRVPPNCVCVFLLFHGGKTKEPVRQLLREENAIVL